MQPEHSRNTSVAHMRFDYCPWLFRFEATDEQRLEQKHFQETLAVNYSLVCGKECYISPLAGLVPTTIKIGNNCCIAAHAYLTDEIIAGDHCTFNPFTTVRGRVTMGNDVRIGAHSSILGFNHNHEDINRPIYQQGLSYQGITIGDDVWIGSHAVILDGINIGSHCIVAAGAVVTKDVPDYALVAGNPARVLRDRRTPNLRKNVLRSFNRRASEQWPSIIAACAVRHEGHLIYVDAPGKEATSIRPLNDAIEIAAAFGALPPHQSREELVALLQNTQDAETGLPVDPMAIKPPAAHLSILADSNAAYMILSIGYALECLGTNFATPLITLHGLHTETLQHLAESQRWSENPWEAGAWVDALGTGLWFNRRHFGLEGPIAPLFDWLRSHCAPHTGLWGKSNVKDGWLLPINGFYRLTRGTFAQFNFPVPYPEAAIDTILAHIRLNDGFRDRNVNACNVLDVIHPLWLMSRQTLYRRNEIQAFMEAQITLIAGRWIDGQGFAFAPGLLPGLQGTEMWLSIMYLAADTLDASRDLNYMPQGVHRLNSEPVQLALSKRPDIKNNPSKQFVANISRIPGIHPGHLMFY